MATKVKRQKKLGDFLSSFYKSSAKNHRPKPKQLQDCHEASVEKTEQFSGRKVVVVIEGRKSVSHVETNLTSAISFLQVKVLVSDMPGFMQVHAFRCARRTYDCSDKFSSKHLAYNMKEFDKVYGPAWHCIVGSNFG